MVQPISMELPDPQGETESWGAIAWAILLPAVFVPWG